MSRDRRYTAITLSISSPPLGLEWTAALSSLSLCSMEDRAPRRRLSRNVIFVVHVASLEKSAKSTEELRLDISSRHEDISSHERPLKCHVSSCGWMKFDVARWGRLAIRGVGSAPLPLQPLTYTTRMVGERGEGNLESYPFDHPGIVFASGLQTAGCHQPVL